MPEHIKSFIVIAFIALAIFFIAKPVFANILPIRDFDRRRNLWVLITLIMFFSHNFWLYIILSAIAIRFTQRYETNKVALFFALLFVAPPLGSEIPLGGIIRYLFEINNIRLLELVILLPAFYGLMRQSETLAFGRTTPDKFLAAYMILTISMNLRGTTFTDTLRFGFYTFIDIFLPYFVVSRSLRDIKQLKEAVTAFVIASLLVAGVAIIEYLKHWLLYTSLSPVLGANTSKITSYLGRGDSLRALVTTGQPIVLGYVMMIAIGFFLFLGNYIPHRKSRHLLLAILAGGLFASLSRGPWVGMLVFLVVFAALGKNAVGSLIKLTSSGILAFILASNIPGGDKLINLLPFIGNVDMGNIDYRERLLETGMIVVKRNPLFGSVDYLKTPEMQSMIQGQGIIDIVNSYLGILLEYGQVGLSLFIGIFGSILWGIYTMMRRFESRENEHYLLGLTILAVLISILVTIYTVSSISLIPILYWIMAGIGVAYIQMVKQSQSNSVSL